MKKRIGILGNLNPDYQPHYRMNACFDEQNERFDYDWTPTETLVDDAPSVLKNYHGIVAGSGPYKSKTGIINGIRYARENNIPFLGTCSGFGYAVLEFGQSIFNLENVYHPYEAPDLPPNETFLQQLEFCSPDMHTISFKPVAGTLAGKIYSEATVVNEESHCYYGIKSEMIAVFDQNGFMVSGRDDSGEPKIMEYSKNDFFIITLFLPQLKQELSGRHPLLSAFFNSVEKTSLSFVKLPYD
jgi:CTP synthase (UTP-ammonia lyase)